MADIAGDDCYGIVANLAEPTGKLRLGAKVWMHYLSGDGKAQFEGVSFGGRRITTWVPFKRLVNVRIKWVPAEFRGHVWSDTKARATEIAKNVGEWRKPTDKSDAPC